MVVQTEAEEVEEKTLVEGTDKWPGGREYHGQEIADLFLAAGETKLVSYFSEGIFRDDKQLKQCEVAFPNAPRERVQLAVRALLVPGQGLAKVSINAKGFLANPILFDLQKLVPATATVKVKSKNNALGIDKVVAVTKNYLESCMKRSFPPTLPYVEACPDLWKNPYKVVIGRGCRARKVPILNNGHSVREEVLRYLDSNVPVDGEWFAHAREKYMNGNVPEGESPVNVLKRTNVFGNEPQHSLPESEETFPFGELFEKLAHDYAETTTREYKLKIIRLIAWTYQARNPLFKKVRVDALKHFLMFASAAGTVPHEEEITLCANLCDTPDEWCRLMEGIVKILSKDNSCGVERTLRLFYNLLQFNEDFAREIFKNKFDVAKTMRDLIWWYTYYALRPDYTNVGYVLRCMLFLLRVRRYDGKKFFTKEHDKENYKALSGRLKCPLPHAGKNRWREIVVEYLNGRGTLPGLATVTRGN